MKLLIATLPDPCDEKVSTALVSAHYQITTIASTSGWLRKGMTTLLIGVEDTKGETALKLIRKICSENKEASGQHPASIFVLKVNEFIHF